MNEENYMQVLFEWKSHQLPPTACSRSSEPLCPPELSVNLFSVQKQTQVKIKTPVKHFSPLKHLILIFKYSLNLSVIFGHVWLLIMVVCGVQRMMSLQACIYNDLSRKTLPEALLPLSDFGFTLICILLSSASPFSSWLYCQPQPISPT